MNKQEIRNKIDYYQTKIDELKEMLSELDIIRWRAKAEDFEHYYYINDCNDIQMTLETNACDDNNRYNIGNYFKTKQEARDYKENLITKQKLKDLALKLNNGVGIDWKNPAQWKIYIHLGNAPEKLIQGSINCDKDLGQIYCLNKSFLDIAIQEIGEDALIKLIKSGV